jgi:4-oxalocrotonate tautomerase
MKQYSRFCRAATHLFSQLFQPRIDNMPVVRVSWFAGKDSKAKQAVAAEITESIVRNTGTPAEYIYVIFEDIAPSDWAGAGKLFGQEPQTGLNEPDLVK